MKHNCTLIIVLLFLYSCKKKEDIVNQLAPVCKVIEYIQNGHPTYYSYDSKGRISIITTANETTTITYFTDSIVLSSPRRRDVYYLNKAGLADSSFTITTTPGLRDTTKSRVMYTYNSSSYLIKSVSPDRHNLPFGQWVDSLVNTYTYIEGNLVKISNSSYMDLNFEYLNEPARDNLFLDPRGYVWPFLGKASKNILAAKVVEATRVKTTFYYSFDNERKITKMTEVRGTGDIIFTFKYECN